MPKAMPAKSAGHRVKEEPRLCVVKAGRILFWPLPGHPTRATEGAFVREDDPWINVRGYPNQAYKLRPITEAERKAGKVVLRVKPPRMPTIHRAFPVKLTPCNNRAMHARYVEAGIDWMPMADLTVRRVSTMTPQDWEVEKKLDAAAAEVEVPPVDPPKPPVEVE